jgi:agmatine deiminase
MPSLDLSIPPGRQGFRMPAEWEPHAATWLAWPHKEASWPGKLDRIPPLFAEVARLLAPGECVHINVTGEEMERDVRARLDRAGVPAARTPLHRIPSNDAWIRDHGPIFLNRGPEQVVVDWGYNAWGGKYPPFDLDDTVPTRVAAMLNLPVFDGGMILEGGSIDVDGAGALLTSESCLLNPNRNPQLTRVQIEDRLRDFLGVQTIYWLGEGIVGDDTDGHIDDLTRFVAPATVVTAVETDTHDPNHEPLRANLERLRRLPLTVHTLPMPVPVAFEGQRLPASYANFYIGNRVVLLPFFDCPQDEVARATLQGLFPGRVVVGLDCRDLVWGLGAFHCLTQQQPLPS